MKTQFAYVAAIDSSGATVTMVQVNGFWQFLGGVVPEGEKAAAFVERRFREQTGYEGEVELYHSVRLMGDGFLGDFYTARMADEHTLPQRNPEGEMLDRFGSAQVQQVNTAPSIDWIWPLMMDDGVKKPVAINGIL